LETHKNSVRQNLAKNLVKKSATAQYITIIVLRLFLAKQRKIDASKGEMLNHLVLKMKLGKTLHAFMILLRNKKDLKFKSEKEVGSKVPVLKNLVDNVGLRQLFAFLRLKNNRKELKELALVTIGSKNPVLKKLVDQTNAKMWFALHELQHFSEKRGRRADNFEFCLRKLVNASCTGKVWYAFMELYKNETRLRQMETVGDLKKAIVVGK
jgi:hypothetical protein